MGKGRKKRRVNGNGFRMYVTREGDFVEINITDEMKRTMKRIEGHLRDKDKIGSEIIDLIVGKIV